MSIPEEARVVVVGAGIAGCSVAHHLAALGWRDIHVLEQGKVGGGTTWHAAGLVGRQRTNSAMARINDASARLYRTLEQETGIAVEWRQTGSLNVARCADRMTQYRRTAGLAAWFGIDIREVDVAEIQRRWPLMRTDDLVGGVWIPEDGRVHPGNTALALAEVARRGGVVFHEGIRVARLRTKDGRVTGVDIEKGASIQAEVVVLCGGMWSHQLAADAGVVLPLWPVEHHYVVSHPVGANDLLPVGRDMDGAIYYRGEGDAIFFGAFQEYTKAWDVDRVPDDFVFQLLPEDWEHFAAPLAEGLHRFPVLREAGIAKFVNGPESFTPDNQFILGEAPEARGLFVAAGFNSAGIASAGGAGEVLAQWIIGDEQPYDLWSVDIRRFHPSQNDRSFLKQRVTEALGMHYRMAWPQLEFSSGRGLRRSALEDRHAEAGAWFGQKMGFERVNVFGVEEPGYSFGRPGWFDRMGDEHRACRNDVVVFDQSGFGKIQVRGRGALPFLQRVCAGDVGVSGGRVVYTPMLNQRGTYESDLVVIREDSESFRLVTGTGQPIRDTDWLRRSAPGRDVEIVDVTEEGAVLGVMGPRSRELLASLSDTDFSHEGFPFGCAFPVSIAGKPVLAVRMTYVGELGWELHLRREHAVAVHAAVRAAGAMDAGHFAINSLRLEKAYRAWGAELSVDESPLEAGLSFAVSWDKPGGFVGLDSLLARRGKGLQKRLATFVLTDSEPMLWGGERIFRNGVRVGYTSSGSYGFSVGGAVAMGYVRHPEGEPVDRAFLESGIYSIEIDGARLVEATLHARAPYDPERRKVLS
ncbi:MAG: FAD-dependent oxidoreductase [Armatimonadota bacterium]